MKARKSRMSKADLLARLPRAFRPKLSAGQRLDLNLLHHQHLDMIAKGEGTEDTLWQWMGSVLTWSKAAELLGVGLEEMAAQLRLAHELVERFGRTGRVAFTGSSYQLAKDGCAAMGDLAELVDQASAEVAADWSERELARLNAECAIRKASGNAATEPTAAPRATVGVAAMA